MNINVIINLKVILLCLMYSGLIEDGITVTTLISLSCNGLLEFLAPLWCSYDAGVPTGKIRLLHVTASPIMHLNAKRCILIFEALIHIPVQENPDLNFESVLQHPFLAPKTNLVPIIWMLLFIVSSDSNKKQPY
jgi:hypothetical protein